MRTPSISRGAANWATKGPTAANLMDPRYSQTGAAVALNEDDDKVIYSVRVYARP